MDNEKPDRNKIIRDAMISLADALTVCNFEYDFQSRKMVEVIEQLAQQIKKENNDG